MFCKTLIAALLSITAIEANAALNTGDLAFTSFNADEDGWSLVTFVDIAADSTLYFSDNAWVSGAFNSTESFHTWNTGLTSISAGSVIRFSSIDKATRAASVGTLTGSGSNFGMSATSETIYAYVGNNLNTPSTFLTGISSESSSAALTSAGLTAGLNAVLLTNSTDYAEYIGARAGEVNFSDYRAQVNNAANWTILVSGAQEAQVPNLNSFSTVPVPGAVWLFGSAVACFTAIGRRRRA